MAEWLVHLLQTRRKTQFLLLNLDTVYLPDLLVDRSSVNFGSPGGYSGALATAML